MLPNSFAESVPRFLWHLLVLHMDLKIWVKTLVCQVKLNKQNVKVGDRENEHVCLRAMFWIKRKRFRVLESQKFRLQSVFYTQNLVNSSSNWGQSYACAAALAHEESVTSQHGGHPGNQLPFTSISHGNEAQASSTGPESWTVSTSDGTKSNTDHRNWNQGPSKWRNTQISKYV